MGTLAEAIKKKRFQGNQKWCERVALRALTRTATEVARGMAQLHDMGVVHGDLKPGNVMLARNGEDRRGFKAKVGDFGLSKLAAAQRSVEGSDAWGTVQYMAPECFQGRFSYASDIWAFGVVLHEMMTGRRPFSDLQSREGCWRPGCLDRARRAHPCCSRHVH